jgi:photosystem II stability/assembly factor-like uncharacterized protein
MNRISFLLFLLLLPVGNAFGQLWQQTNGSGGDRISSMAVNTQGHIFVVSRTLQRSTDGGVSWVRLLPSTPFGILGKIAAQPSGRLLLSMGQYDNYSDPLDSIVFSDDNGNSWKRLPVNSGYFWQGTAGMLFAVDGNCYVRSTNDGNTWDTLTMTGLGGSSMFYNDHSGHLFASNGSLYRSTDNGKSWGKIVNGLTESVSNIVEAPNNDLYAYSAGYTYIAKSIDGGRTWTPISFNYYGRFNSVLINSSGKILIIDDGGRFNKYSSDNGQSWTDLPTISDEDAGNTPCAATEPNGSFLFSMREQFYRFSGQSGLVRLTVPNGDIGSIISHPNGNIITFDNSPDGEPGAWNWCSTDQGNTWPNKSLRYPTTGFIPLAIDSAMHVLAGINGYVRMSVDSGLSWKVAWNNGDIKLTTSISAIGVRFNGEVFVTSNTEGVFRSLDNGKTWDQLNSGITNLAFTSLAIHQNGDIYAGGKKLIFKSTNDGLTWSTLNTNFPSTAGNVTAMVVNTRGDIIAGVENAGVFWSTNNGVTWSEKAKGLSATRINALVSTPVGKVFAATNNGVFFLDTTAGANWVPFNFGITATNILSLCRDASGRLYAGTEGSGVFRSIGTFNSIIPGGPIVEQSVNAITFPGIEINTSSDTVLNNVIKNGGEDDLMILGADIESVLGDKDFSITSPTKFPITLAPGASESFTLRFKPLDYGSRAALLRIYTNTSAGENDIGLDGMGMMKIGVKNKAPMSTTSLGFVFPNPIVTSTTIPYLTANTTFVHLDVTDALGRVVAILIDGIIEAGSHQVEFNASGLSAGVYHVRLRGEGKSEVRTIVKTSEP